jgi:hypothetical protein
MSKKAVLTKTIQTDQVKTIRIPGFNCNENAGRSEVTIPHAKEMRAVFEPGMSLMPVYLPFVRLSGIIFRL